MITTSQAIKSLDSSAEFSILEGEITWITTPMSTSDIETEQARLQAEYDSQEYARQRKAEYDKLNQFEMQFNDQRDGTTTWVDAINDIKAKYPKGGA